MERQGTLKTALAGIQWLFFMFANTIVIPLTIGHAFELGAADVALMMQRSFILTGAACLMQVLWGHKWVLMEGQAGLWWGVIISLCASAPTMGITLPELGASLAVGIVLAGVTIILLGLFGVADKLRPWFNPNVMFVILLLIGSQLMIIFSKGMLGLNDSPEISPNIALLSFAIIVFLLLFNLFGPKKLRNFSVLIGIIVGWIAYALLFDARVQPMEEGGSLWKLFTWGSPTEHSLNLGVIGVAYVTGLLNMANSMATLKGAAVIYRKEATPRQYSGAFVVTGIMHMLAGLFGVVPYSTFASSIGFLQASRILNRLPYIIGAVMMMVFGFVPQLAEMFSALPLTVGNAVLFVAYLSMLGASLKQLEGISFTSRSIYRVALPLFIGLAWMTMPNTVWVQFPALIRPLISNGLLLGMMITLIFDRIVPWDRIEEQDRADGKQSSQAAASAAEKQVSA
ncbi:uracil/xanthine transporter [Paenibacillus sp. UMB4589-SE434]|uniref:uracil/xanthine transporter n=1 Tax=Paenibacillus sp. UMB4589-SE434 TaxID=3046314 RepID=UPI00254CAE0C|nr:uracil/xanthine transporter [Paenibacillus sp. UMB4589-SE434]MDK8183713.1 uracil/xanthine transporter [Paenibacillus sp. UMB4589-SE434]